MPEWLILMAVAWLIFGVRRGRGCHWSGAGRNRWRGASEASAGSGRYEIGRRDAALPPRRPPPETVEQRLQRQFVEGRLTVEEYEAALWRELRSGGTGDPPDHSTSPTSGR